MKRGYAVPFALVACVLTACGNDGEPDAYGNFEAVDVVVSAESGGQVREFLPAEGMRLEAGAEVVRIDTTQLALERDQIAAQQGAAGARSRVVTQQLRAIEAQREVALRALERTRRLHDQRAATAQQLDQAEREFRVLDAQLEAARSERAGVRLELESATARAAQVADRLQRSTVRNPVNGTVLALYARVGEVVRQGQPLYRIADLDTLELRAYVSGAQLSGVRLGQRATVHVDGPDGSLLEFPGVVTWIAGEAEFTPTPVQTRDDRAELVYAVRLRVGNPDGVLKIGMPADVTLAPAASSPPNG